MWDFLMCIGLPLFSFLLWQISAGVWPLDSCFFPHSYTALCWQHHYKFKCTGTCGVNNGQHVSVAVSFSWQSTRHRANWTMSECYCCVGGWKWDWRLVLQANVKHLGLYPVSHSSGVVTLNLSNAKPGLTSPRSSILCLIYDVHLILWQANVSVI